MEFPKYKDLAKGIEALANAVKVSLGDYSNELTILKTKKEKRVVEAIEELKQIFEIFQIEYNNKHINEIYKILSKKENKYELIRYLNINFGDENIDWEYCLFHIYTSFSLTFNELDFTSKKFNKLKKIIDLFSSIFLKYILDKRKIIWSYLSFYFKNSDEEDFKLNTMRLVFSENQFNINKNETRNKNQNYKFSR